MQLMKNILLLTILMSLVSCTNHTAKKPQPTQIPQPTDGVEVLYFHGKQRCITCNAIERLTKEVVDSVGSVGSNKIVMRIIDISQNKNQAIADKYEVSWSSLIIVYNGKVENLTQMGFAYAKNRPTEFKMKLTQSLTQIMK